MNVRFCCAGFSFSIPSQVIGLVWEENTKPSEVIGLGNVCEMTLCVEWDVKPKLSQSVPSQWSDSSSSCSVCFSGGCGTQ